VISGWLKRKASSMAPIKVMPFFCKEVFFLVRRRCDKCVAG
jgi:hypothetical protein